MYRILLLLIFSLLTHPAIAVEWLRLDPIRQGSHPNAYVRDVESRLTPQLYQVYYDSDVVTATHECTHGINSTLRQKHGYTGEINAFYCLGGKYIVLEEPDFLLEHIKSKVRRYTNDSIYQLYLGTQLGDWNDSPLYCLDEWVAYTNGAEVRDRKDSLTRALKFNFYVAALLETVQERDTDYPDLEELKDFIGWNIRRTFALTDEYGEQEHHNLVVEFVELYGNPGYKRK